MKKRRKLNSPENEASAEDDRPFLQKIDADEIIKTWWIALKRWSKLRDPEDTSRERAFTTVAFVAIAMSAMALTASGIMLPLLCAHVNNIQTRARLGLEYCQGSATDVHGELRYGRRVMMKARAEAMRAGANATDPAKRSGGGDLEEMTEEGCSPCCIPGEPGPAGKPGKMGLPVRI